MHKTTCFMSEPPDYLKWIGKALLTIAAGIILDRFGVRFPDNAKL